MRQNCLWNGDCDHCGARDCIARPLEPEPTAEDFMTEEELKQYRGGIDYGK